MDGRGLDVGLETTVVRTGRANSVLVLLFAALNWVGWAAGIGLLTRVYRTWPPMTPWTALWLAALAAAILVQSGRPSVSRVWAGRTMAVLVGVVAVAVLAEYAKIGPDAFDQLWFGDAVRTPQSSWPGRPSPQTAWSVLLLSAAVALIRVDRRWARLLWPVCMVGTVAVPAVSIAAYLFGATALVKFTASTGQAMPTAVSLLLLVGATSTARPDRHPLAWVLARPDRRSLIRLAAVLGGFPIVVALSRLIFMTLGLPEAAAWTVSIAVGTVVVGVVTFYLSQREQRLLIERDLVSRGRAEAEARYRLLADNAVDIIVQLRGNEVAWISPSVEAAFGRPREEWIGSGFRSRIHPEDLDTIASGLQRIAGGEAVLQRFRVGSGDGDYHWVDGHAKPYVDAQGNTDGLIAALRVVDSQVEAEQRLERLARFDTLTGLANRAEAISRLKAALDHPADVGAHIGILFCDVDHFKQINDTWGHGIGDAVLTTLAARIVECVQPEDTVGRTGGDEILVLLPGVRSLDEAAQVAEKIRCRAAEPIRESGNTIFATLSVGATIAIPGEPVSAVTARADTAMYAAKVREKSRVIRIDEVD